MRSASSRLPRSSSSSATSSHHSSRARTTRSSLEPAAAAIRAFSSLRRSVRSSAVKRGSTPHCHSRSAKGRSARLVSSGSSMLSLRQSKKSGAPAVSCPRTRRGTQKTTGCGAWRGHSARRRLRPCRNPGARSGSSSIRSAPVIIAGPGVADMQQAATVSSRSLS